MSSERYRLSIVGAGSGETPKDFGKFTVTRGIGAKHFPQVILRESELVVGCFTITRKAWVELNSRWEKFLSKDREAAIQT